MWTLVDAVCGTSDGAGWLRQTAATNQLLIGLDTPGTWYRYHQARPLLAQAERMAPGEGHVFVEAVNPIFSAITHLENGDPRAAHADAARAIELAHRRGLGELAHTSLAHSVLARATRDPDTAITSAKRGVELACDQVFCRPTRRGVRQCRIDRSGEFWLISCILHPLR